MAGSAIWLVKLIAEHNGMSGLLVRVGEPRAERMSPA
jgi:hypothetical protein